jgi:molybdopterin synthase catalytic subunit
MITDKPIPLDEHLALTGDDENGAAVVFAGVVRADEKDGRHVVSIHYDCYRDMAERELADVVETVRKASGASSITAVHRVGAVPVGEVSLLVVSKAGHRAEAYDANRLVVEEIKRRVPIWKKEIYDDESSEWV